MSGEVQAVPSPQEAVERALAAARCDDCVVIADESSSANLRWASNSLTTNGVWRSRQLTVIAISRSGDEARVGVVSRAGVRGSQIADVVAEAEAAAAAASPAEDAQPLVTPAAGAAELAPAAPFGPAPARSSSAAPRWVVRRSAANDATGAPPGSRRAP